MDLPDMNTREKCLGALMTGKATHDEQVAAARHFERMLSENEECGRALRLSGKLNLQLMQELLSQSKVRDE